METFEGCVEQVIYRNAENGYTVFLLKTAVEITAVGILPEWCGDFDPSVFRLDNVFISIKKDFDVMYNMKTKNAVMMKSVLSFLKNFNKEGEFSKNSPLS